MGRNGPRTIVSDGPFADLLRKARFQGPQVLADSKGRYFDVTLVPPAKDYGEPTGTDRNLIREDDRNGIRDKDHR